MPLGEGSAGHGNLKTGKLTIELKINFYTKFEVNWIMDSWIDAPQNGDGVGENLAKDLIWISMLVFKL